MFYFFTMSWGWCFCNINSGFVFICDIIILLRHWRCMQFWINGNSPVEMVLHFLSTEFMYYSFNRLNILWITQNLKMGKGRNASFCNPPDKCKHALLYQSTEIPKSPTTNTGYDLNINANTCNVNKYMKLNKQIHESTNEYEKRKYGLLCCRWTVTAIYDLLVLAIHNVV